MSNPPSVPIITSIRPTHVPLLRPLMPLASVLTLMAYWRRLWPETPSFGLDFPLAMISKISELSPVTSPVLIVVELSTATIRLFPASIHPMEGFIVAIAVVGVGSAVLR